MFLKPISAPAHVLLLLRTSSCYFSAHAPVYLRFPNYFTCFCLTHCSTDLYTHSRVLCSLAHYIFRAFLRLHNHSTCFLQLERFFITSPRPMYVFYAHIMCFLCLLNARILFALERSFSVFFFVSPFCMFLKYFHANSPIFLRFRTSSDLIFFECARFSVCALLLVFSVDELNVLSAFYLIYMHLSTCSNFFCVFTTTPSVFCLLIGFFPLLHVLSANDARL